MLPITGQHSFSRTPTGYAKVQALLEAELERVKEIQEQPNRGVWWDNPLDLDDPEHEEEWLAPRDLAGKQPATDDCPPTEVQYDPQHDGLFDSSSDEEEVEIRMIPRINRRLNYPGNGAGCSRDVD